MRFYLAFAFRSGTPTSATCHIHSSLFTVSQSPCRRCAGSVSLRWTLPCRAGSTVLASARRPCTRSSRSETSRLQRRSGLRTSRSERFLLPLAKTKGMFAIREFRIGEVVVYEMPVLSRADSYQSQLTPVRINTAQDRHFVDSRSKERLTIRWLVIVLRTMRAFCTSTTTRNRLALLASRSIWSQESICF